MFKSKAERIATLESAIREAIGQKEWLEAVRVKEDGRVSVILRADAEDLKASESRRIDAETAARAVEGVVEVNVALTAERTSGAPKIETTVSSPSTRRVRKGARLSDQAMAEGRPAQATSLAPIPGIRRIIAVASAKGGVGKSTIAVNLAVSLARQGLSVGLLDADIYGPSVPTMLGTVEADPRANASQKLEPVVAHGVKSLSIGYLTDPDAPMIWRGPMVMSAITQLLNDAAWGTAEDPLDMLIIDTPPGTGDAALTLAQRIPLTGAIIVTTPQEVALADVRRGAAMFTKTAVPVLGIVETMSWFEDPAGNRHALFGEGGGRRMAEALGLPLLAELPILTDIRVGGDTGVPVSVGDNAAAAYFTDLAVTVTHALDTLKTKSAPEIIFEA